MQDDAKHIPEINVEDRKDRIDVYGDLGWDCATFSDDGLELFLKWCNTVEKFAGRCSEWNS